MLASRGLIAPLTSRRRRSARVVAERTVQLEQRAHELAVINDVVRAMGRSVA